MRYKGLHKARRRMSEVVTKITTKLQDRRSNSLGTALFTKSLFLFAPENTAVFEHQSLDWFSGNLLCTLHGTNWTYLCNVSETE